MRMQNVVSARPGFTIVVTNGSRLSVDEVIYRNPLSENG